MIRYTLVHPQWGIFTGTGFGFAFWSMMETGGQSVVPTFKDLAEAKEYAALFEPSAQSEIQCVEVDTFGQQYADIKALKSAGLSDMIGLLDPRWNLHPFGYA